MIMEKEVCEKCRPLFEELLKKICELEKRLLAYENAHTPPSLQKKKKRIPRISSGKLGAQKGHLKYERQEPEITETKKYSTEFCPHCSCKLNGPEKIFRFIEEELPTLKSIKVVEHLIDCFTCKNCGRKIVSKNNAPSERFGPNLKSHITLLKHDDRLPLRKVAGTLNRNYNLKLTHVGIMKIIIQVAKKLNEPYYEIIKQTRSSRVVYVDETGYKLDGEKWWLWTFVTENCVLFVIRKSRSKDVVEEILGKKFEGIISCDGWKTYTNFSDNLQRCWAHLLRESHHLKDNYNEFEKFHKILCELFERIVEIRLKPPSEEKRRELAEKMKLILLGTAKRMSKHAHFEKFAGKIENGMDYWFTCVMHLEVEPTNNFAEQALRELIVQRKIMGGLRSEKGAETLEVISTMIATWKKQSKPLLETMKIYV
ncbi:MAG: IS66 family transposase [Nanoarchaeota archaeon]|nr:IS66 family transposase [Nanoarchaeota archaeon]